MQIAFSMPPCASAAHWPDVGLSPLVARGRYLTPRFIAPTINQADSAGDLLVRPGQHLLLVTGKLAHVLLQLRQLLGELCY
jgi:hypothetical protein